MDNKDNCLIRNFNCISTLTGSILFVLNTSVSELHNTQDLPQYRYYALSMSIHHGLSLDLFLELRHEWSTWRWTTAVYVDRRPVHHKNWVRPHPSASSNKLVHCAAFSLMCCVVHFLFDRMSHKELQLGKTLVLAFFFPSHYLGGQKPGQTGASGWNVCLTV